MRRARITALALAVTAAGCGTPSADLLVIERAGSLPDARVTLVIGDGGAVQCDGREETLSSELLLDARELTDDLEPIMKRRTSLPIPETSLLRYRVTGEAGAVDFGDSSPDLPEELGRLIRFTRAVATQSCGLDR